MTMISKPREWTCHASIAHDDANTGHTAPVLNEDDGSSSHEWSSSPRFSLTLQEKSVNHMTREVDTSSRRVPLETIRCIAVEPARASPAISGKVRIHHLRTTHLATTETVGDHIYEHCDAMCLGKCTRMLRGLLPRESYALLEEPPIDSIFLASQTSISLIIMLAHLSYIGLGGTHAHSLSGSAVQVRK